MSCFLTNSSLGKKLVMSVTGCFLVLFILFHMSMNIVAIISPDGYVLTTEAMPSFEFEGERLTYSAMREVDYQNQDLEVGIYFTSSGFAAGTYRMELYTEGRLIGQAQVVMR